MSERSSVVIWKYEMMSHRAVIKTHEDAQFLSVGVQDGIIVLWAEVDPTRPPAERVFEAVNTGSPLPPLRTTFMGSVQVAGWVMWHVYELLR
jgi:hypothetical protein